MHLPRLGDDQSDGPAASREYALASVLQTIHSVLLDSNNRHNSIIGMSAADRQKAAVHTVSSPFTVVCATK